jgi:DNA-binding MarR family transcriptional regulator
LDGGGPATSSELAKREQIRPQSMGATLGALQSRGLIERHPDPADGRRVLLSVTDEGRAVLRTRRDARAAAVAEALRQGFTRTELKQLMAAAPLIERLSQSI